MIAMAGEMQHTNHNNIESVPEYKDIEHSGSDFSSSVSEQSDH